MPRPDFYYVFQILTGVLAISHFLLPDISPPFLDEFLEKELAILPHQ